jgi:hypothetical protein
MKCYNNSSSSSSKSNLHNSYERWEVCISSKMNINSYVGYCKAQFNDERRKYVVVKARGLAIENALKVVQLVMESQAGISSCIRFGLHFTHPKRLHESG